MKKSRILAVLAAMATKTITEKVYVCAKCQKEYKTAKEAIDCCAETPDTTAPRNVTELAAAAKDSSVVLTWKDATDEDIFGYLVSWKAESTGRLLLALENFVNKNSCPDKESTDRALVALEKDSLIAAKGQQGCVVTGLKNGTKYTFTVKTMDTSGNKSAGVTVKATPVAVDSKETMKIVLSVPEAKSNTSITVTANITTAAQSVEKVVYKKNGSEVASKLLADSSAIPAGKDITDNKRWTFEITATDETANGMYTVAAIDYDGREETAQISISNFDFTPPKVVSELAAKLSAEKTSVTLTWKDPDDEDFDHVEICFVSNDGKSDSGKSETVEVKKGVQAEDFAVESSKAYYEYYIVTVDTLGNKSSGISKKVYVDAVSKIPEGFVEIPAVSISGSGTWTPASDVFVRGRVRGRKLEIASFYMSDHEVTRGEYKAVMGSDPSKAKAYDKDGNELTGDDSVKNNPVNNISWYDALVYCNTRSINEGLTPCYEIDGKIAPKDWGSVPTSRNDTWDAATCDFTADGYRLPTEAEWEWAARGGGESYTYAGSDNIDEVAWYTENTNDTGTRDVKTKKANGYGLYDMSGNVWEWCWDWYGSISRKTPGTGPASGSDRCQRGGSWLNGANCAQVAYRYGNNPSDRDDYYDPSYYSYYRGDPGSYFVYGFRLVRSAQ